MTAHDLERSIAAMLAQRFWYLDAGLIGVLGDALEEAGRDYEAALVRLQSRIPFGRRVTAEYYYWGAKICPQLDWLAVQEAVTRFGDVGRSHGFAVRNGEVFVRFAVPGSGAAAQECPAIELYTREWLSGVVS